VIRTFVKLRSDGAERLKEMATFTGDQHCGRQEVLVCHRFDTTEE